MIWVALGLLFISDNNVIVCGRSTKFKIYGRAYRENLKLQNTFLYHKASISTFDTITKKKTVLNDVLKISDIQMQIILKFGEANSINTHFCLKMPLLHNTIKPKLKYILYFSEEI